MDTDSEQHRILVVEDDSSLATMVSDFLTPYGFDVSVEGRGDRAVDRILSEKPDAMVLDINLPGLDGISVCRSVRADYSGIILILTARGDEIDEVVSLEVGADDYMTKPVRPRALLARLQLHLRRSATVPEYDGSPIVVGSLKVDPSRRVVELNSTALTLTTAEFDLLQLLAENAGRPLSRRDIYERIHGMDYDGLDRSIDLRISRLRRKLGDDPTDPERIKSVRGVGYFLSIEP
ncbi:MAG: response regulator transcription factor [Fuerstiella sp.]